MHIKKSQSCHIVLSLCQALQADHVVQDYYKNRSLEEAEPSTFTVRAAC